MKFAHIAARLASTPWLIREESLRAVLSLVETRAAAASPRASLLDTMPEEPDDAEPAIVDGVAVITVSGILGKRLSMMETACGGCDYDDVVAEVEKAAFSLSSPRGVVLVFDSPGGTVVGCPEAHRALAAIVDAADRPIVAFTDTQCCSAAYYLASACTHIYATETADVGSTGTKLVLRDDSVAIAQAGVKFHVFKSGTMKDIGASYRPPTEAEAARLQAVVDAHAAKFRADVLAVRPQVQPAAFETALFYFGAEAEALGLVDAIVPDLRSVVAQLAPAPAAG